MQQQTIKSIMCDTDVYNLQEMLNNSLATAIVFRGKMH